jgi:hypothetical protein
MGDEATDENRALVLVMEGDGGVPLRRYLGEGIAACVVFVCPLVLLRGKPYI